MAIPPALIVGPDAATAALVAAAIVPLAAAPDERVRLASALALLVAGLTAVGGGGLPWDVDTGGTQCRADGTELARPTGALRDLLRAYGLGELTPTADLARRDLAASVDEVGPTTTETSAGDGVGPDGLDGVDVDPRSGLLSAPGTPEPKPTRRLSLGVVLLGTLVIVVLALAIGLRGGPGSAADQVTTPNLIGLTYARARSTADGAGLVLGEPLIIQSAAMAEGTVVAQDPDPGTVVSPGTAIIPTVSTAHGLVTVPDVTGLKESDAIVRLTTSGLRVGSIRTVADATTSSGFVLATELEAGRSVAQDTSVGLVVSRGPQPNATAAVSPAP